MNKFTSKFNFLFAIFGEYSLKTRHPLALIIYPFHITYYLFYKGYLIKYLSFIIKKIGRKSDSLEILKNKIINVKGEKMDYIFCGSWSLVKVSKKNLYSNDLGFNVIYFDNAWWNNYWHFMIEALPLLFIISKSYKKKFKKIYLHENDFWRQIYPFFYDLGIDIKVIFINGKNEIKENYFYKFSQFPGASYPHPELVKIAKNLSENLLNLAVKKKLLKQNHKEMKNIFLIRDQKRRNTLISESAKEFLNKNKFQIYNSSKIKFIWDGLQIFSKAEKIIVPHGAGLVNMLVAKKECEIVELYSPIYSNIVSLCLADYLKIKLKKIAIWPAFKNLFAFKNLSPLGRIENDLKVDLKDLKRVLNAFS